MMGLAAAHAFNRVAPPTSPWLLHCSVTSLLFSVNAFSAPGFRNPLILQVPTAFWTGSPASHGGAAKRGAWNPHHARSPPLGATQPGRALIRRRRVTHARRVPVSSPPGPRAAPPAGPPQSPRPWGCAPRGRGTRRHRAGQRCRRPPRGPTSRLAARGRPSGALHPAAAAGRSPGRWGLWVLLPEALPAPAPAPAAGPAPPAQQARTR